MTERAGLHHVQLLSVIILLLGMCRVSDAQVARKVNN